MADPRRGFVMNMTIVTKQSFSTPMVIFC